MKHDPLMLNVHLWKHPSNTLIVDQNHQSIDRALVNYGSHTRSSMEDQSFAWNVPLAPMLAATYVSMSFQ